jgi:hypothetical protein
MIEGPVLWCPGLPAAIAGSSTRPIRRKVTVPLHGARDQARHPQPGRAGGTSPGIRTLPWRAHEDCFPDSLVVCRSDACAPEESRCASIDQGRALQASISDLRASVSALHEPIAACLASSDSAVRSSPRGRRLVKRFLERAGEGGFRVVSNSLGDLCKRCVRVAKFLTRYLHAPTSKVMHRWHADETNEAVGQRRT